MPELPEVETVRRALAPLLAGRQIARVLLRVPVLRWPIPPELPRILPGQSILAVDRRAKYLLLRLSGGCAIVHLGMTGHLRLAAAGSEAQKHDHFDIEFTDGSCLRFHDPRRFGALLWTEDPLHHPLLAGLGPEPFSDAFDGSYLFTLSRGRRGAVKPFIMDQRVVVGVGNIYASEALFRAGIGPAQPAGRISGLRYERLAGAIRGVLADAIAAGGTTIRDFKVDGKPGYFARQLQVYGREGEACPLCCRPIRSVRLGGRSTYFCGKCQK